MSPAVINPQVCLRWRNAHRMALLAVFEDSTTGTRVKEFCQGLSRELGSDCRIIEHVWLFNTLRLRELQEIAAEEASASDLVIISTHQDGSLPDEVKGWFDLWLQQTARPPAILLALFDSDYSGGSSAVQAYLQNVARQGGMEFLIAAGEITDVRYRSS